MTTKKVRTRLGVSPPGRLPSHMQVSAGESPQAKIREFTSGITGEFLFLFCVNGVFGCVIAFLGADMNRTWPGRGTPFIVIGVLVAVAAVAYLQRIIGKSIKMTSRVFLYRERKREILIPWENFRTFQPSHPGKRWFRSATVGDYDSTFSIDSVSFPDYELIVNLIAVARKRAQGKGYEIGG